MEKKSSTGLVVGLVISILVIIGLAGYIVYDKIQEKERINAPIIDVEKQEKLKEEDVKDLIKRIDEINSALSGNYPIKDINSIPTRDILSIGFNNIYGANYVSSNYIENHIKYIIGDNIDVKHEDYLCSYDNIAFWKYKEGYYILNNEHPGHGGGHGYLVTTFFKDATLDEDTIVVNTNLLYEPASDIRGPIASYRSSTDGDYVINDISREDLESEYEKIKDKLPVTTFTFKRSKLGGYNLETVTIK